MSEENEAGTGTGEGGEKGGGERAWLSSIPENLREHEAFKGVNSLTDVYQGFADMTVKSKDLFAIPGDKATDDEKAAFFAKLGRPEAADKYGFTKPADLPESVPYQPEVEAAFKQIAFENGLSDSAAGKLYGWYWGLVKQGHEMQQKQEQEATEKAINVLKDDWKGDAFKENSELAVRAFRKFGGDEAKAFIETTKINGLALGDHPVFLKTFAAIGKAIADDPLNAGRGGSNTGDISDEDRAKARFPNTQF